jgi:hypothetical protein
MPPPRITMRSSVELSLLLMLTARSVLLLLCKLCARGALRPKELTVLSAKQSVKGASVFMQNHRTKITGSVRAVLVLLLWDSPAGSMLLRAISWAIILAYLPLMLAFLTRSSSNCVVQHSPTIRAAVAPLLVSRLGVELPSLTHRDLPEETLWVLDGTSMLFRAHFGKGSDR